MWRHKLQWLSVPSLQVTDVLSILCVFLSSVQAFYVCVWAKVCRWHTRSCCQSAAVEKQSRCLSETCSWVRHSDFWLPGEAGPSASLTAVHSVSSLTHTRVSCCVSWPCQYICHPPPMLCCRGHGKIGTNIPPALVNGLHAGMCMLTLVCWPFLPIAWLISNGFISAYKSRF